MSSTTRGRVRLQGCALTQLHVDSDNRPAHFRPAHIMQSSVLAASTSLARFISPLLTQRVTRSRRPPDPQQLNLQPDGGPGWYLPRAYVLVVAVQVEFESII